MPLLLRTTPFLFAVGTLLGQGALAPSDAPAPTQYSLEQIWELVGRLEANNTQLRAAHTSQQRLISALMANQLAWQVESVRTYSGDETGEAYAYTDLALGPDGEPTIAYHEIDGTYFLNAQHSILGWESTFSAYNQFLGTFANIAFLPDGTRVAACYDSYDGDLVFTRQNGPFSWGVSDVDTAGDVGQFASMAIAPDGHPAIAYYDATNKDLKYARHNGTTWTTETIAAAYTQTGTGTLVDDIGTYAELVFFEGRPLIACLEAGRVAPILACYRFDGSAWQREQVVTSVFGFAGLSMALDSVGAPNIAYGSNGTIYRASRNPSGNWGYTSSGNYGEFPSMALAPDGNFAIAYRDTSDGSLKFDHPNSGGYATTTIVDFGPDNGYYPSLVFGADGLPRIAYYDNTSRSVKYAHRGIYREK